MKRRRLTFQLVSLFDLLIIILFAQYFDLQARMRDDRGRLETQQRADSEAAARLRTELELREEAVAQSTAEAQDVRADRDRQFRQFAATAEQLLRIDPQELTDLLAPRTREEQREVREALARLQRGGGTAALRQLLTLHELEKRCDLWQVHVTESGACRITALGNEQTFRAEETTALAGDLVRFARGLPEPKSLVVLLLSWDDASLADRERVRQSLDQLLDRLRADEEDRTRFEQAELGYLPNLAARGPQGDGTPINEGARPPPRGSRPASPSNR